MSTLSQFSGGEIKSIQRGTISLLNSNTVTITAVNTAKTILNYCGCSSGRFQYSNGTGATMFYAATANIALTSSTQITATGSANSSNAVVSYEVIEYF